MNTSNKNDERQLDQTVDGPPAEVPQPTVLIGRFVSLTPVDPNLHAASLFERSQVAESEQLWRYLPGTPPLNLESFKSYLASRAAKDRLDFAIVDNHSNEAIGLASYLAIEPTHRRIEVGNILFTPRLQRTPGGTEAMYLLAKHAFELRYRRYEWKCNALNDPSRRAALRYGFQSEGIFRQHMIVKGKNRDTAWFSILDSEWPTRKAIFECWLDPSNFLPDGSQRISLSQISNSPAPLS
ncbi:GNAT family N-acetyltransferase [Tunturiibacter gelidoferens]|uniref:RimJ/RimL family protein N-acetyltransferase n=1 Tax=Tunturiibacter gelidiferens TaxID=3069689 RepID=A0A9X0U2S1_9BACT|nr:GNAT family protein [Edaphobacter lichenicola]MBB5327190.1 RimJ/RimL family protein N-acetyltransferase [Edaphobacter lichenicola]